MTPVEIIAREVRGIRYAERAAIGFEVNDEDREIAAEILGQLVAHGWRTLRSADVLAERHAEQTLRDVGTLLALSSGDGLNRYGKDLLAAADRLAKAAPIVDTIPGHVIAAGGGEVRVVVARGVDDYPSVGAHVVVQVVEAVT